MPPPPSPLPPFTFVRVVLQHAAPNAMLPHVGTLISDFLDRGLLQFWSLPRACEANLLSLLPRLAVHNSMSLSRDDVDPHYWKYQCRQALVFAVRNDNLEMLEWIYNHCPIVLPYLAMVEAAKTANV